MKKERGVPLNRIRASLVTLLLILAVMGAMAGFAETVASGTCGENLTWTLNDGGLLTISGSGDMTDYEYDSDVPWYDYCQQINQVVVESGVTSVGGYAFYDGTNITEITLPEGVTEIKGFAFFLCESLKSIQLPSSLKKIITAAFMSCKALEEIEIPMNVEYIGNLAFGHCSSLKSVTIPRSVTMISTSAFARCTNLEHVHGMDGVTKILNNAFDGCTKLTEVTLPETLTSIGTKAFSANLERAIFLSRDTKIEDNAFSAGTTFCCYHNSTAETWAKSNDHKIVYWHFAGEEEIDAAVEPTCTQTGLTQGSHCPICGEIFQKQEILEALGHDWSEAVYTWSEDYHTVTAKSVCSRDDQHVKEETVSAVWRLIQPPTETEEGSYVCESGNFEWESFTFQSSDVFPIPPLSQMHVLRIPAHVREIEAETFAGIDCQAVIIPDECEKIGAGAFRNCKNLLFAYIPSPGTEMAADAFEGCENVLLYSNARIE